MREEISRALLKFVHVERHDRTLGLQLSKQLAYSAMRPTQHRPPNRKRLQKALDRIETEIALGSFDYAKTFGKPLPQERTPEADDDA